jgi:hypothetical protein
MPEASYRDPRIDHPEQVLTMDSHGLPLPPWRMYAYWPTSMGWRMGGGEEYIMFWGIWHERLDREKKREYRRRYRAPIHWFDFFWNYGDGMGGCLLQGLVGLPTLPIRIPAYFLYYLCWPVRREE